MWRKKSEAGAPSAYTTWLSVWMDMNRLSVYDFAKIAMVSETTVQHWRAGDNIGVHYARMLRAYYPDVPVYTRGGPVPKVSQPLPAHSRSVTLYKFILKVSGLVTINPTTLEHARGIKSRSYQHEPSRQVGNTESRIQASAECTTPSEHTEPTP